MAKKQLSKAKIEALAYAAQVQLFANAVLQWADAIPDDLGSTDGMPNGFDDTGSNPPTPPPPPPKNN